MRNVLIPVLLAVIFSACEKDQSSSDTKITDFSVTDLNRSGFTIDQVFQDDSSKIIYLLFSNSMPADSFPLQFTVSFALPAGATSNPASGGQVTIPDIDQPLKYTVSAENGKQDDYYVVLRDNQLPNHGFEIGTVPWAWTEIPIAIRENLPSLQFGPQPIMEPAFMARTVQNRLQ